MGKIDWPVLSGPRVSRREMIRVALASGSIGYAAWLAGCGGGAPEEGGDTTPTMGSGQGTGSPSASPTGQAETGEPKRGGTLRYGYGIGQILTLDPGKVTQGIVAGGLLPSLFSSLVQFDKDLGLVPDLAEDWEVSEDGLEYTFALRDGLKFHNGDPLTAEDFVFTYERTINPDIASPHAYKLELVDEITAPDDLTLKIRMSSPYAPFLATACSRGPGRALTPVSKRALEEMGEEEYGLHPIGTGPFKIVPGSHEIGKGFEMEAFEDWYGGRPNIDKIVVRIIPEVSSRISALEAGDIDMLDIVPTQGVEQLQQNNQIVLVEAAGTNWQGLAMNPQRAPWDRAEARLAVAKAIDTREFVEKAFFGLAVPSVGPIAPAFAWVYRPPEEVDNKQAYALEEATLLAEQAGLAGLKPVMIVSAEEPRPGEVIRNMLEEIGLDVQIEQLQSAAWYERWQAGNWDLHIGGSQVDADPDDGHWNHLYSEGPSNPQGYKNEQLDAMLEQTRSTTDQDERAQLFQQLQTLLEEDAPYKFLYHLPDRTAFYDYIKGYVPLPEQRYFETMWIEK